MPVTQHTERTGRWKDVGAVLLRSWLVGVVLLAAVVVGPMPHTSADPGLILIRSVFVFVPVGLAAALARRRTGACSRRALLAHVLAAAGLVVISNVMLRLADQALTVAAVPHLAAESAAGLLAAALPALVVARPGPWYGSPHR